MSQHEPPPIILMVDDDPDDYYLTKAALEKCDASPELHLASNGEELLDYVFCRGRFAGGKPPSIPNLILLDLNMPKKNGLEVLAELKADPVTNRIPVVIYSNAKDSEHVAAAYRIGADGYIQKPAGFQSLVDAMAALAENWLKTVDPPSAPPHNPPSLPAEGGSWKMGKATKQ